MDKLSQSDVRTNAHPITSSNLNGRWERVIFTLKQHVDYLLGEFVDHFHTPHSSMVRGRLLPVRSTDPEEVGSDRDQDVRRQVGIRKRFSQTYRAGRANLVASLDSSADYAPRPLKPLNKKLN